MHHLKAAWDEQKTLRQVHIFLQTYGVTTSQCVKLVQRYGNEAKRLYGVMNKRLGEAKFLAGDDSPIRRYTPERYDVDGVFDVYRVTSAKP